MIHVLESAMENETLVKAESNSNSNAYSFGFFSRSLKDIANQITNEEFASMKLLLQADQIVKKQQLDESKTPQDLLRFFLGRELITKKDTSLLKGLLKEIGRMDLLKILDAITDLSEDGDLYSSEPSQYEKVQADSLPDSQMSIDSDTDEVMSSQNSISDDDKLLLKKVPDD